MDGRGRGPPPEDLRPSELWEKWMLPLEKELRDMLRQTTGNDAVAESLFYRGLQLVRTEVLEEIRDDSKDSLTSMAGDLKKAFNDDSPVTEAEVWTMLRSLSTRMAEIEARNDRAGRGVSGNFVRQDPYYVLGMLARLTCYWCSSLTATWGQLQYFDYRALADLDRPTRVVNGVILDFTRHNCVESCNMCKDMRTGHRDAHETILASVSTIRSVFEALFKGGSGILASAGAPNIGRVSSIGCAVCRDGMDGAGAGVGGAARVGRAGAGMGAGAGAYRSRARGDGLGRGIVKYIGRSELQLKWDE